MLTTTGEALGRSFPSIGPTAATDVDASPSRKRTKSIAPPSGVRFEPRPTTDADAATATQPPLLFQVRAPFNPAVMRPEIVIEPDADHSDMVRAFRERLFRKDVSASLFVAYAHRDAAAEERKRTRAAKRKALRELRELQNKFAEKKKELLDWNSKLKESSKKLGGWNRKVFELELVEPCPWNDKLAKLREYVAVHGRAPEHSKKTTGTGDERQIATFLYGMRNKVKKGHPSVAKFPHRVEALKGLGVRWESENDARFETMFAKLLEYKKEHGTFRMPSLDLCKESGDADLIALHNWVFSQVGSFRYQLRSKKVEAVKRFLDVGFSFEKWYATNGHVFERSIPKFDDFCRRYVENGGRMDEGDVEALRAAQASSVKKMRRKYKKRKRKGEAEEADEAAQEEKEGAAAVEGADAACGDKKGKLKVATDGPILKTLEGEMESVLATKTEQQQQQDNAAFMEGAEGAATSAAISEAASMATMAIADKDVAVTANSASLMDVSVTKQAAPENAVAEALSNSEATVANRDSAVIPLVVARVDGAEIAAAAMADEAINADVDSEIEGMAINASADAAVDALVVQGNDTVAEDEHTVVV